MNGDTGKSCSLLVSIGRLLRVRESVAANIGEDVLSVWTSCAGVGVGGSLDGGGVEGCGGW